MARTRAFKLDDGQAIRIPAELAYPDIEVDLEITRFGDVITICPARNAMSDSVAELRRMQEPDPVKKLASVKKSAPVKKSDRAKKPDVKKPDSVKKNKRSAEASARRRG